MYKKTNESATHKTWTHVTLSVTSVKTNNPQSHPRNHEKRKHKKAGISSGWVVVGAARGTSTNFVRNDQKQSYSQFHPPSLPVPF